MSYKAKIGFLPGFSGKKWDISKKYNRKLKINKLFK